MRPFQELLIKASSPVEPHVSTALQPPGAKWLPYWVTQVHGAPPSHRTTPSQVTGSTGCSPDTALTSRRRSRGPRKPTPLKMGQLAARAYLYLPACFTSS